ncbi:GAF domain-containing protein [Actinomycetospora sp. CA-101289]|uniref:GAF domain-containing protein n=1 Tax=Actinomycetospora sp. CA-101289 TaxID=3239893 RepID=UPI003D9924DE
MLAWLRSWKGGTAVAAACFVIGGVRVASAEHGWLTWILFPLAAGYGLAAVVDRRAHHARRTAAHPDPTRWTTQPSRLGAWFAAQRGRAHHPGQAPVPVTLTVATSTKDRVGALLAITAAVVGLVLVFQDGRIEGTGRRPPRGRCTTSRRRGATTDGEHRRGCSVRPVGSTGLHAGPRSGPRRESPGGHTPSGTTTEVGAVDQVRLSQALAAAVASNDPDAPLAVCRACVAWLPVTGAALTVMAGPDRQEPVCATDDVSARIDELQFSLGDGPCVESFSTGRAVLVPDIADPHERRWPVFAAAAADTGARGMFVFPLNVGASRIGVLDCYRDTPGGLDDRELTGALRAADAAVWTLLDTLAPRASTNGAAEVEVVDGSSLTRAEVHQATGMLLAQGHLSAAAALARLRAAAFTTGRTINDIADDVLARRLRLHPDGSWHSNGYRDDETIDHPAPPRSRGEEDPE